MPVSIENVDVKTVARTVPSAEKKITVVATRMITDELSFSASRRGIPSVFLFTRILSSSISLPGRKNSKAIMKNRIFAI